MFNDHVFNAFMRSFEARRETEMSLSEYLEACRGDERRQESSDIAMTGVRHGEGDSVNPHGAGDRLLGNHPASGADGASHPVQDHRRIKDVHEQETTEGQVHQLREQKVLAGLGDGDHL